MKQNEMNLVLGLVLHSKAILGWGRPGLMRKIFGMNHAPGAGSINLFTCSLACYHCAMTAPTAKTRRESGSVKTTVDYRHNHSDIMIFCLLLTANYH